MSKFFFIYPAIILLLSCTSVASHERQYGEDVLPIGWEYRSLDQDKSLEIPLPEEAQFTVYDKFLDAHSHKKIDGLSWYIHFSDKTKNIAFSIFGTSQNINPNNQSNTSYFLQEFFSPYCENGKKKYQKIDDKMKNGIRLIHFSQNCDISLGTEKSYVLISRNHIYLIETDNQPDSGEGVSQEKKEIMESIVNNIRLVQ